MAQTCGFQGVARRGADPTLKCTPKFVPPMCCVRLTDFIMSGVPHAPRGRTLFKRMSNPPTPPSEDPHSQPEVLPPGQAERGTEHVRVYIAKPGPLGTILVVLIVGLLSAVFLLLLLGALLIWLPVVVLFVTGAIVIV